ncbi:MAG: pyridoxamine 5'-phosphate oxidase family protein [Desulfatibacillum sp.]|nr:pyridoxamine 5'-phosphate oxidase family protein [Desulfatibacillum sp.]
MRRSDKEITHITAIEAVIAKARVCRVAFSDENQPYIVPLCFGYTSGYFYVHSAALGKKLDILRNNPLVCVQLETGVEVIPGEGPCNWGMRYQSVTAMGKARFVEDMEGKRQALDHIMARYTDQWTPFPEKALNNTVVIEVEITQITGKQSGQPT